ncbi:NCS2 family permease [Anaerobacillus isosaccharinicus]|uniref:Guanine permease n=1 Tax=Anaerobacillus isosaccharinicus TaxID=1532552 RepID=A0A1S2MGN9_9BACI|nr:NCS2 family permease [Anaerobacillus isosaccharinicus]MBA5588782.1 NCS2 family permease [Anaerobacillus isosaccharinicus]QOY37822.1 NCS2 family permease [Anaerobacillus isosaccharinicus]
MDRYFGFKEHGTSYRQETVAGITTFLAMAYILFVNPLILSDAGMDSGAVFTATALAAAIGTLIMGVLAKYPIALAPGMGLNAFFAYGVVLGMGIPWETALFGVFISGLIFILITVTKIRETIINAIPAELKYAAAAGIGLFIAFIGLKNAGIIIPDPAQATIVALGHITSGAPLLAVFGVVITVIFMVRGYKGGIFYGMLITAVVGIATGIAPMPSGIIGAIPSLEPTFLELFRIDFSEVFTVGLLVVILTFLFVDFFDTAGTLYAVANQAGFVKDNKLPRADKALLADSSATSIGAILGTSTTTAYIESSAGVAAGGRTGFTSVVTAVMFVLALFFSPLLVTFMNAPSVTAPALIIVGILMASSLSLIDWKKFEIAVPAFLTVLAMPLTFSIATGIAMGFIMYPITMVAKGRAKEVHPIMYVLFFVFIAYFVYLVE